MKAGWVETTIGDACQLATGGTPSKSRPEYFESGDIKWLVSGDVHRREIWDCEGRISKLGYENSNARFLPLNSVIIALNGQGKTRGTVALLRTEATCNQSLVAIAPRDANSLMPEYLYYNLHGRYEEIRRITGDGGNERRGLNMPIIRSIHFPLPPLDEQKRIVAVLDEAFEGLSRARANAEANLADARDLFNCSLAEKVAASTEGWKSCAVSASFVKTKVPAKIQRKDYLDAGRYPIISQEADFINGYWDNEADLVRVARPVVVFGDHTRHIKFVDFDFVVGADGTQIMEPISEIEPAFYFFSLRSIPLEGKGYARHFSHLKKEEIKFPPDLGSQRKIAEQLAEVEEQVQLLERSYRSEIETLDTLRQSLLQKAFSGELTSTDVVM